MSLKQTETLTNRKTDEDTAQWAESLPCKAKDRSLDPQDPLTSPVGMAVCL